MRNYAKFCKISIGDEKLQLNLTEGGRDDAGFINKFLSVNFWLAPIYMLYKGFETFYLYSITALLSLDFLFQVAGFGVIFLTFCLPISNVGKAFNAMIRNMALKSRTKKYYKKMRKLEEEKTNLNINRKTKKQMRLTNKFVKKLRRITNYNDRLSRKYEKKIDKKGFVDGTASFAYDNIVTIQEGIDKFVFHNQDFLSVMCPKFETFIDKRSDIHYQTILSDNGYYDEYIYSAKNKDKMLVKNDCIMMGDTTNYFDELREVFKVEDEKIETYTLEEKSQKIEKVKVKTYNNIYREESNEKIF